MHWGGAGSVRARDLWRDHACVASTDRPNALTRVGGREARRAAPAARARRAPPGSITAGGEKASEDELAARRSAVARRRSALGVFIAVAAALSDLFVDRVAAALRSSWPPVACWRVGHPQPAGGRGERMAPANRGRPAPRFESLDQLIARFNEVRTVGPRLI